MQIRITGSANLSQAKAEFAELRAQIAGVNAAMASGATGPVINPAGYRKLSSAVEASSESYRNALASTGQFHVEQMRLNSATAHYTELLQKQKLTFKEMRKHADIMRGAYREQLAAQEMVVRRAGAAGTAGGDIWDVATPRTYSKELDNINNRLGWTGARLKSAGTQMVNFGKNTQWSGRQLTVGFTMPLVALGAAAGYMAYKVDKELTRIRKVYDTTANQASSNITDMRAVEEEFAELSRRGWETAAFAAREYGATAQETLAVQAELAATGERGLRLQNATREVMKSAMLGEIDHQTATTATIALQQQLNLSAEELTESWAYMNSVENATSLQMKDFAQAIPIALGPMRQMGGTLQDLGTLMTAMVSRGVQVGKAANAIKALPQRLLRPSKQIQEEWKSITGTDILQIAQESGGNVMKMLERISAATKDLSDYDEGRAFAGLFGSYQLTTMSNMIAGVRDLEQGIGQVTTAQNVANQSSQQWLSTSNKEIEAYQESVSGRFKNMIASIQVELAEFGTPFLSVLTFIGEKITDLLGWFNDLSKTTKLLVAIPVVLMAIAGPLMMLVGLAYNLAGSGIKALGAMMSLGKSTLFMTNQERAMALAFKQSDAAMLTATGRAEAQSLQMKLLAGATTEAERAMLAMLAVQNGVATSAIEEALNMQQAEMTQSAASARAYTLELEKQAAAAAANARAHLAAAQKQRGQGNTGTANRFAILAAQSQREADDLAKKAALSKTFANQAPQMIAVNLDKAADSSDLLDKNVKSASKGMGLMGISAATTAASMGLMMATSNETANNVGQMLMMAGLIGPMFSGMGGAAKNLALRMRDSAKAAWATSAGMNGAARGAKAFGASMLTAMGPVGWIAAALAALGTGIWILHKRTQEKMKQEVAHQKAIAQSAGKWAEHLGTVEGRYKTIRNVSAGTEAEQANFQKILSEYEKGGSQSKTTKAYKSLDDFERTRTEAKMFLDLQAKAGMGASEAADHMRAMFIAAGQGYTEAKRRADDLRRSVGLLSETDWTARLREQAEIFQRDILEMYNIGSKENLDIIRDNARNIADVFSAGYANATSPEQAMTFFDQFRDTAMSKWDALFNSLSQTKAGEKFFKEQGISSADEFSYWFKKRGEDARGDLLGKLMTLPEEQRKAIANQAEDASLLEKELVLATGAAFGLGNNVQRVNKLLNQPVVYAAQLGIEGAREEAQKLYEKMGPNGYQRTLDQINQINLAQGIKEGVTPSQALFNLMNGVKDETAKAAVEARNLKTQLNGVPRKLSIATQFTGEDTLQIKRTAMEGVMEEYASAATNAFDNRMNSAMDSAQAGWDARIEAAERAGEKASERLDSKWERLNERSDRKWERRKDALSAYYDKRIKLIDASIKAKEKEIEREQKNEELRQKMFEAEKSRIERLNNMANQNIDFNVAINTGNLDEAAKIRNDMQAQVADWALSDAADAGQSASDRRIANLERQQERIEGRKDRIEEQRDAALKALENREKLAKASLARREKNEKAHLQRVTKANQDALRKQADEDMKSQRKRWEHDKKTLDQRLTLFKSYTARNQRDLERWMKQVGLTYDDFGLKVKGKGENWSKHFRNRLAFHIRKAGSEIANDKMWTQMGNLARGDLLRSMGFKNLRELRRFITKGVLPEDFGNRNLPKPGAPNSGKNQGAGNKSNTNRGSSGNVGRGPASDAVHSGGEIGSTNNRVGVARNLKGLHSSERLINAQVGEYLINRRAAKEHRPLIEAINKGTLPSDGRFRKAGADSQKNVGYGVGGAGYTVPGLVSAFVAKAFITGIARGMQNQVNAKTAAIADAGGVAGGIFGAGKAGEYGGRAFSKAQLRNAATIASVGSSMGMSKRDIQIGIMTAITESGLVNVNHGDRDSLGLFQQRPSQGWGTPAQVTDPEYASRKFFNALKGHKERNGESPWLAAQHVQRSAFSDGSNYAKWWNEAVAIYNKGLRKSNLGGSGGIAPTLGPGGKHRASVPGKGWNRNTHDYGNGLGSPIYAIGDGRIIRSRAITSGGSPGNGEYRDPITGKPYRSYGETITMRTKSGVTMLAGHLAPGQRARVGPVKGGAIIGRSGSTGNSSGPHTHFEVNGSLNARGLFEKMGIGLKTGGYTTSDGMANLHKDEVVISPERTAALYRGLDTFTSFMDSVKNVGDGVGGATSRLFGIGQQIADTTKNSGLWNAPNFSSGSTPRPGPVGTKGKKGVARTATFNVHAYGHSNAKSIADLKKVMARSDSIALQEFTSKAVETWMRKSGWGVHHPKGQAAVAWRKSKYTAVDTGNWDLNKKFRMPKRTSQRYAPHALLKERATGKKFWQVSAHLIPGVKYFRGKVSLAHRNAILNEQYARLRMLTNRLDNRAPVVLGGDFNERRANRFKGMNAYGSAIDRIYSQLKKSGGQSVLANKKTFSDHPAVFSNYKLPRLKTGGYTMNDGLAQLHGKELVVDAARTKILHEGIENLASGGNATYNVHMHVNGQQNVDVLVNKTMTAIKRHEARKPQKRRG